MNNVSSIIVVYVYLNQEALREPSKNVASTLFGLGRFLESY